MTVTRKIIRTDGTETVLDRPHTTAELAKLLDVQLFDTVVMRHMGEPMHVMLVDDHGHHTMVVETPGHVQVVSTGHRKPVNEKATELYLKNCRPGTVHKIVGDVAIVPDEDFAPPAGAVADGEGSEL